MLREKTSYKTAMTTFAALEQAVTAEDLAKRRDELAKMRSLLFRHEEKSRHLAKIKSKDYHRRMKKSARLKVRLLNGPKIAEVSCKSLHYKAGSGAKPFGFFWAGDKHLCRSERFLIVPQIW